MLLEAYGSSNCIMPKHKKNFALITGTSSGLGKATAIELLSRDWKVCGTSRRDAQIIDFNYTHFKADLIDINSFKILSKKIVEKLSDKKLERIALNNNVAGLGETVQVENLDPLKLQKLFTLNVIAPTWLMGLFYKNRNPGTKLRIMNISSGAASKAYPGLSDYGSTKAVLKLIGDTFFEEHSDDKNLAILSYELSVVDTEMQENARSQTVEKFPSAEFFKSLKKDNKLVKPEAVAKEIADFFDADDRIGFSETRFGNLT